MPIDPAGGEPGQQDPEAGAWIVTSPDGTNQWETMPLPEKWPTNIPLLDDARVIFRERLVYEADVPVHIIIESQVPEWEAAQFYIDTFDELGWRWLETSKGRGFLNCTYFNEGRIIDVLAKHVPEELEVETETTGEQESDFEGTIVKIQIMPIANVDQYKGATSWISLDDVPPGFPLDELPRYPGGVVDMARFDAEDVVMEQHCSDEDVSKSTAFYRDHFTGQGLVMEVVEETDVMFMAEFTAEDCFVRLTIDDNTVNTGQVFILVYKHSITPE